MSEHEAAASYAAYLWERVKECRRLSTECVLPRWIEYYRIEHRKAIKKAWDWRKQARIWRDAEAEREWEDAA